MIVTILLPLILAFIMFSLGLGLKGSDFSQVLQFPKAFATGLVNQLVLLPVLAFILVSVFQLGGELAVGVMILAFSPGGVTTNILTRMVQGNVPLSISMTAFTSLLSILTVPIFISLAVVHFMGDDAPPIDIAKLGVQMFLITALPVLLGMLFTKLSPVLTAKISPFCSKASILLFVLMILAALAKNWDVVWSNMPLLGPVLVVLNLSLLAIGFSTARLVGLNKRDGYTIAIETGIQNGTLGIAVGVLIAANVADGVVLPPTTVPSAVYGITMYVISMPILLWLRGSLSQSEVVD
jgi:BASS family bile acid:Na+ symporter